MDADHIAAAVLAVIALLMLLAGLIVALSKEPTGPHAESLSERKHRLDDEARAATRPASSNRKAGRTGVTR